MNRPALRIAVVVTLADVAVASLPVPPWLVWMTLPVVLVWTLWYRPESTALAGMLCAGVVLGLTARDVLLPMVPLQPRADRCRVEGTVTKVLRADSMVVRLAVRGTIDARHLPPMRHRAVLSILRPTPEQRSVRSGQHVIATGRCDVAPQASLPDDHITRAQLLANDAWWLVQSDARRAWIDGEASVEDIVLDTIRRTIAGRVRETFPADVQPIVAAILTGDARAIPAEDREAFARTGTAHMFSVSGSHVALIASALTMLTAWLAPRWRAVVVIALMMAFVGVTGAQPPAVRALLAASCVVVGRLGERDLDGMNLLGAAVIMMIVLDPVLPWRVSAQLSIGGVAGILLLTQPLTAMLERVSNRTWYPAAVLRTMLSVSIAAGAGVAIPSAMTFGSVVLLAPVANIVVVPLLSAAMLAAAAAVVLPWDVHAPLAALCVRWATEVSLLLATLHTEVRWPVLAAMVVVLTTWWICGSTDVSKLTWRLALGVLITLLVMIMPDARRADEVHVRPDLVAYVLTSETRQPLGIRVVLVDRQPAADRPRADRTLARHLLSLAPLVVYEHGLCAGSTVDKLEDMAGDSLTVIRLPWISP